MEQLIMARKAATNNSTQNSPVDLAALYEDVASTIKDSTSKEVGKYLTWSYIREDTANVIKFLCEKRNNNVETGVIRQFLVAVLTKKVNDLPTGGSKMTDKIGTAIIECTLTEFKERKVQQLAMSSKSTNVGPTITRILGSPSSQKWLKVNHNITYDGMWHVAVVGVEPVEHQTQEENTS